MVPSPPHTGVGREAENITLDGKGRNSYSACLKRDVSEEEPQSHAVPCTLIYKNAIFIGTAQNKTQTSNRWNIQLAPLAAVSQSWQDRGAEVEAERAFEAGPRTTFSSHVRLSRTARPSALNNYTVSGSQSADTCPAIQAC